jgi:hypothetical protein
MAALPDCLVHYYLKGRRPFQSLSALDDEQALPIMQALASDAAFGRRFQQPLAYLHRRRATEQWVRRAFIAKGGTPILAYPIYMVLGRSPWIEAQADETPGADVGGRITVPLAYFGAGDVSFTYPDSMISLDFAEEQPPGLFRPDLHGHVFTRSEILTLVAQRGHPEDDWEPRLPSHMAPYIEAQVWNEAPLAKYADLAPPGVE